MERKSFPVSLLARQKVETPDQDEQVPLPSIFDKRKKIDGSMATPQRILIRGQAGVGKTTLCKWIVYNYLRKGMWAGTFDRLFWVPLRTLKARSAYTLEDWLRDEYFRAGDGDMFAKTLGLVVDKQRSRTLFILDGLDEVSRELASETAGLLHDLLKQPDVIITSRPSGVSLTHVGRVDLELETVGFYPDQVQTYVRMAAGEHATDIEEFLQGHWLLQGLVRIPIQLEALCYSWDASMKEQGTPTTMTTLYRRIESKLWKKDAARLGKPYEGEPLSEDTAKQIHDREIAPLVIPEVNLLRCLAFTGLCSDVIEFDKDYQDKIWEHWSHVSEGQPVANCPSSLSLAKVSFLRSSDASSSRRHRSYHFLHLTFQEFFAAQYFVEHWNSGKKLPSLLRRGATGPKRAEDFLHKEKYNARYDVFWRFVAGLLHEKSDEQLCRFFRTIDEEPRDLLGPTHQRLVMHCLNEAPSNNSPSFNQLRTGLETQLSLWILFECECSFQSHSSLAGEMELPEKALDSALQKGSEDAKVKILGSLRKFSATAIQRIPHWLKDEVSSSLKIAVLKTPQPPKGLPSETLHAIAGQLRDNNTQVQEAAVNALGRQATLSSEILQAIASRLEDDNTFVREAAVTALGGQVTLSPEILQAIASRLEDDDTTVQEAAFKALRNQVALSPEILQATARWLEDDNGDYRWYGNFRWFQNDDREYRWTKYTALGGQATLSPETLQAIAGQLEDNDKDVQQEALIVLGHQAALSPEILQAIAYRLKDTDNDVRWAALTALKDQAALSPEILQAIACRLEDDDEDIQEVASTILRNQEALSPEILQALARRLEDNSANVRCQAVLALRAQAVLSPEILQAIACRLEDNSDNVRYQAVLALRAQAVLSPELLQGITYRLEVNDRDVQWAAITALGGQAALLPETLQAVAGCLEVDDTDVQVAAVIVLSGQAALSPEILIRYIGSFYRVLLRRSFEEHLSWYLDDGICIDIPGAFTKVPSNRLDLFRDAIRGAQKMLRTPYGNHEIE